MTHDSSANREPLRRIPTSHAPPAAAADIGTVLKAARQAKGRTLELVRQETRIPKKFLEAMEENRLDEFPALVYLRGFLKGYCDYLELDFEPLWKRVQPPEPPASAAASASRQGAAEAPAPRGEEPRAAHAPQAPETAAPSRSGVAATLLSLALAIGLALWLRGGGPRRAEAPPAPSAPAALQPIAAPEGLRLEISFRDEAWISVKADGAPVFAGLAPKGARQDWKARRSLTLRTPDPAGLTLTLNGSPRALPAADEAGEYKIELP